VINPLLKSKYGLEMTSFVVENVSVPPEVEAAIDKRSSMAAIGNLNDYVKFQMAQGMAAGGSNVGGVGAEMAVGFAIAKEMMNQTGGPLAQATPAAAAPAAGPTPSPSPAAAAPQLLSPADAAALLSVSEADVIASLESGDLKGKRIGTQWRITRAAIDDFLK
jgi:excisionase family DNA binding protein